MTSFLRPFLSGLVGLVLLVIVGVVAMQVLYSDNIHPGVHSGPLALGGKSAEDAKALLEKRVAEMGELRFYHEGRTFAIKAEDVDFKADVDATVQDALAVSRGSGLAKVTRPVTTMLAGHDVRLRYQLNAEALKAKLIEQTGNLANPAKNAGIIREGNRFAVTKESAGTIVDAPMSVLLARGDIEDYNTGAIPLPLRLQKPDLTARELGAARAQGQYLASLPVTVTAGDRTFTAEPPEVYEWIGFERQSATTGILDQATIMAGIDEVMNVGQDEAGIVGDRTRTLVPAVKPDKVGEFVRRIGDQVDKPPVNARLAFTNGTLQIMGAPSDGVVVDPAESVHLISKAAVQSQNRRANLPIVRKEADVRAETLPKLGITTLIGSSTTTFGGSPVNRTYNIGVGASKFDGALIAPGEEFSFNKVLGDVGPETGFRPELVIKENKTTPEYGGGLCQVSTTMFRAAMDAGLPITARTNHSYAVHYYAPIGMDATIYPPNPDMRFRNNTKGWILVQTHTAGQSVTFDFYGTSDGRTSHTEIIHISATEAGGGTASFRYVVEGGVEPINHIFSSTYQPQSKFPISRSLN